MNTRNLSMDNGRCWYFALFIYFCVSLNQDWVTVQLYWWGSILLLTIAAILKYKGYIPLQSSSFLTWMVIFIAVSACSAIYAINASIVFTYLKTLVVMLFAYYLIYHSIKTSDDINKVVLVYIISTAAVALYLLLKYTPNMFILSRVGKADTGNWNGNSIGIMMTVGIFLSFILLKKNNRRYKNILLLLIDALYLFWIIVTASRKAIIILVGGICLYIVLLRPKKIIRNIIFIISFVVTIFYLIMEVQYLYDLIGWRIEGALAYITGTGTVDNSYLERHEMIELGLEWFKKKPVFGYGMDNFRVLYGSVRSRMTYAHNNYVEIVVDLGIVGLIAYYWIFIKIMKDFFKDKAKNKQDVVLFSIIIMYLVSHFALVAITDLSQNLIIICILAAQALKKKNSGNEIKLLDYKN